MKNFLRTNLKTRWFFLHKNFKIISYRIKSSWISKFSQPKRLLPIISTIISNSLTRGEVESEFLRLKEREKC